MRAADNPGPFAAPACCTVSGFLDPVQWLISGRSAERLDHAMIAGAAVMTARIHRLEQRQLGRKTGS